MSALASSLLATFAVSLASLVGLVFLFKKFWNARNEIRVVGFAAGVLLAAAFLDLLPEALAESDNNPDIFLAALVAMVGFFLAERVIHGTPGHRTDESHIGHHASSRYFILFGDGVHNFIDGVAIAASFIVSPELGLATTLAVIAHEIPHEVGDYGILVRGGYSPRRALFYNFLSALTAVLGALATFAFGGFVEDHLALFIAATAGMFIYIAAANLIPEIHHQRAKGKFLYATPFVVGVVLIAGLLNLIAE